MKSQDSKLIGLTLDVQSLGFIQRIFQLESSCMNNVVKTMNHIIYSLLAFLLPGFVLLLLPCELAAQSRNRKIYEEYRRYEHEARQKASTLPSEFASQMPVNGGFEIGTKGQPDGWYGTWWEPFSPELAEFKWDSQVKRSGRYSASIHFLKNTFSVTSYAWRSVIEKGFEIGDTYELTGWIKTRDLKNEAFIEVVCMKEYRDEQGNLSVRTMNKNGHIIYYHLETIRAFRSEFVSGTKDWTIVKLRFKPPKGTNVIAVAAGVRSWLVACCYIGQVWFDDILITKVRNPD